jgi:uncharacterized protein (DUF736 family)
MATIGTFTQDDAGNYNGSIKTLKVRGRIHPSGAHRTLTCSCIT